MLLESCVGILVIPLKLPWWELNLWPFKCDMNDLSTSLKVWTVSQVAHDRGILHDTVTNQDVITNY